MNNKDLYIPKYLKLSINESHKTLPIFWDPVKIYTVEDYIPRVYFLNPLKSNNVSNQYMSTCGMTAWVNKLFIYQV